VVGSLLLGLYDDSGLLHHVGYTSSFNEAEKKELTKKLEPLIARRDSPAINLADRVAGARRRQVNGNR